MPTYTFLNSKTEEIEEHMMSMAKYDDFVKEILIYLVTSLLMI